VPRGRGTLRPGWPLTAALVGYPLWWLLGVAEIVPLAAAVLMARELLHTQRVRVRRGFGVWLMFLAWVLAGALLLQVDAPGAVPGGSPTRYLTYTFRFGWYAAATITLMYVYNMRDRLPTQRITRAAGWLFVTVVAGGVLGTLAPHVELRSAIELALPHRISNVQFVHDMIHPVLAQVYTAAGAENPRASAPFAYTNDWGLNFACLLPFFLVGWLGRDGGWRRRAGVIVLLVAIYPVVQSANRGLWLALVVCGVLVATRAALSGQLRLLGLLTAGALIGAVILAGTPIGTTIQTRLENGYSDQTRTTLGEETVNSVLGVSAVLGLGTTRNVQGAFYSIAGGDSASCSLCAPPALGTQGHLWLLIYSTGLGGLLFYLGFVLLQFVRHLRIHAPPVTLGLSVIAVHLTSMFVYDTIGIALVLIFLAIGLMWREAEAAPSRGRPAPAEPTVGGYVSLLREHARLIAIVIMFGLVGGVAFQFARGTPAVSTTTILLPTDPAYVSAPSRPQTLDTVAALVDSPEVLSAISTAAGRTVGPDDQALSVTATPNTRLLSIHFSDRNASLAADATEAAAKALIKVRAAILQRQRDRVVSSLQTQQDALLSAIVTIGQEGGAKLRGSAERRALIAHANAASRQLSSVESVQVTGGAISTHARIHRATDRRLVALCSGVMMGLALGVLLAFTRHLLTRRVGRQRSGQQVGGLAVLERVPAMHAEHALALAGRTGPSEFLSAGPDHDARAAARLLDSHRPPGQDHARAPGSGVILVAGPHDRARDVDLLRRSLEHAGARVRGLVLVEQRADE
jgi:capsular polysaccharide biosynthesis protein